ncbi:hypothetical protein BYT27DRAFT_6376787 [Phlegmacium glaucopus]|nr:hypothetical protein BYT27DRAFT_6376787 [Phlegmacium glaucopus]
MVLRCRENLKKSLLLETMAYIPRTPQTVCLLLSALFVCGYGARDEKKMSVTLCQGVLGPLSHSTRGRQCNFSGVVPSCDSDPLVATWVFPLFLGYKQNVSFVCHLSTHEIGVTISRREDTNPPNSNRIL